MKIGIVVNVMKSDEGGATTYRIATECVNRGHEVWIMSTGNFVYDVDNHIRADARSVPVKKYRTSEDYLAALNSRKAIRERIAVDELDVLMLRSNPSVQNAWAQNAGIHFGRLAMQRGVIVLNHPDGLSRATNKLYLESFPEETHPRSLITRNEATIKKFAKEEGTIVIKPLQGSGGKGVFIVRPEDRPNLGQMIRSVSRDGYVIAQQYLAAAAEGDTRLFLMNGVPLCHKGKYAAFRRVRTGGDMRSNIHAGGKLRRATIDDTMLKLAEMVRPRLAEDGMYLVGLDIVGDKLMEINVFSPGGLGSAQMFEKINFPRVIVEALERKVDYARYCRRKFNNLEMATL